MVAELVETRSNLRGAVGTLAAWIQGSLAGLLPGKNGGVPKEVMIAGVAGSGKSYGIASILLWLASHHQGVRILVVRRTRASLTESVCVTIEKILGPGHPSVAGASRENRHDYKIGRSTIVLGSMENPDRLYSTEWDIVWIEEAREVGREGYLKFLRSLRNRAVSKLPFQLLLTSTNPDSPAHHLYQRAKRGKIRHLVSVFKDNPAYWDEEKQEWTLDGSEHLDNLRALEGNLYRRLYLGEWVASEGAIYPSYDPEIHSCVLARDADGWVTEDALKRIDTRGLYVGYDFGFGHPGALILVAYTGKRKAYAIEQVLMSGKQITWFAERLREWHERYRIELAFCDPSRKDAIYLFNEVLGVQNDGPGAIAVKANNDVFSGCQIVRGMLDADDPRFFIDRNSLREVDPVLKMRNRPTRLEEEIPNYVFKTTGLMDEDGEIREEPVKERDDLCDGARYVLTGLHDIEPPPRRKRLRVYSEDEQSHEDTFVSEEDRVWDSVRGEVVLFT